MEEIDTLGVLRAIYDGALGPHEDLHARSNAHREAHGEGCSVHPSALEDAPFWPLLVEMLGARRFLEVGCGLGYTAAVMGEAGGAACHVDTIEADEGHADLAEEAFRRRGLAGRIQILRGQARDLLPRLEEPYDVVFVDADWSEYPDFLPDLIRLTRSGGLLVSANLFPLFADWARDMPHKDAVEAYLRRLVRDERMATFIIPDKWHALSYRR